MRTTIPNILLSLAFVSIACAIDARIQAVKAVLEEHGVPQSLGINIQYESVLDIEFEQSSTVTPGMSLFEDDVTDAPTFRLTRSTTTVRYSESQRFVVAAIKLDGSKQVLSYLEVESSEYLEIDDEELEETESCSLFPDPEESPVVPWEISDVTTEAHKVVFLVFNQPSGEKIQEPSGPFDIKQFAESNGFEDPIAANLIFVTGEEETDEI